MIILSVHPVNVYDYAKEKRSQIVPFFEADRVLSFMGKGSASIFFK